MSRVKFLICTILAILFLFFFFLIKKRSNSADGRLLVWKIASSLITDNFFFGIGIDKFKYAYPDKQIKYFQSGLGTTREITLSSEVSFTFNDLIQIQIETGIIGLAICIVATFQAYKNFQYYKKNKSSFWQLQLASLSGITSLLVYSNFSYPFSTVELTVTFFLLVAIVNSGIGRHVKKRMSAFSISILLIFFSVLALYSWERIYTFTRQMHFLDLAYKYSQTNRNLEATRTFKHLTKDNAMIRNPGFMSYYSRFLLGLGKYKEAESLLRKKNNILPSYDDLIELAATYELLGDTSLAIGTYWKAYFLLPHKFKPIYHIMLVHERRREGDRAKLLAKYLLTKPIKVRSTEVLKMRSTASLILNR